MANLATSHKQKTFYLLAFSMATIVFNDKSSPTAKI